MTTCVSTDACSTSAASNVIAQRCSPSSGSSRRITDGRSAGGWSSSVARAMIPVCRGYGCSAAPSAASRTSIARAPDSELGIE